MSELYRLFDWLDTLPGRVVILCLLAALLLILAVETFRDRMKR